MGRAAPGSLTLLFAALCVDQHRPAWMQSRVGTCLPRMRMTGKQESIDNFSSARILDYRQDVNLVEKAVGMTGKYSYSEAYKLVKAGRVTVDGTPATTGQMVNRRQVLALDGVDLPRPLPMKYYLVNKPRGVLCTCSAGEGATAGERRKQEQGGNILQHVPPSPPLVPCGRLDYESEGLIIMTNDGSLVHCITSPKYNIPKTYQVKVVSMMHQAKASTPSEGQLRSITRLGGGIKLQNGSRLFCEGAKVLKCADGETLVEITFAPRSPTKVSLLLQGRNREIRKLMKGISFRTLSLVRVAIGGITGPISQFVSSGGKEDIETVRCEGGVRVLKRGETLEPGDCCELLDEEVTTLFQMCSGTSSPAQE